MTPLQEIKALLEHWELRIKLYGDADYETRSTIIDQIAELKKLASKAEYYYRASEPK